MASGFRNQLPLHSGHWMGLFVAKKLTVHFIFLLSKYSKKPNLRHKIIRTLPDHLTFFFGQFIPWSVPIYFCFFTELSKFGFITFTTRHGERFNRSSARWAFLSEPLCLRQQLRCFQNRCMWNMRQQGIKTKKSSWDGGNSYPQILHECRSSKSSLYLRW